MRKRIFNFIMVFAVMLVSIFALVACGGDSDSVAKIKSVTGLETEVAVGTTYTYQDAQVVLEMTSGKEVTINASDEHLSFSTIDTSTVGVKEFVITYTNGELEVTFTVNVQVYQDSIVSISSVSGLPKSVRVGKTFDASQMEVTLTMHSGRTRTLSYSSQGLEISSADTSTVGQHSVTITYGDLEPYTFYYTVYDKAHFTVLSAKVKEGTYSKEVNVFDDYDTSKVVMELQFQIQGVTDVQKQEYQQDDLTIVVPNTYVPGNATLKASFYDEDFNETYNATATVSVLQNFRVTGFTDPSLVTNYAENSVGTTNPDDGDNDGDRDFIQSGNVYLVGDDNDFVYEPKLIVRYNGQTQRKELTSYASVVKVYLVEGADKTLLSDAQIEQYFDLFDTFNHKFDFNDEEACGKTFFISVLPDERYGGDFEEADASTFTFRVSDGYNIYDAVGFSLLDNCNFGGQWTDWKNARKDDITLNPYGVDFSVEPNALVLHANIPITKDDLPAIRFWTAQEAEGVFSATDTDSGGNSLRNLLTGSLKDYGDYHIYRHQIGNGKSFKLEGNYFTVDASEVPLIFMSNDRADNDKSNVSIDDHVITVHIDLFKFFGEQTDEESATNLLTEDAAKYEINNISFFGNTKKSQDATKSGGLICFKKEGCNLTLNNVLSQAWYIPIYSDEGNDEEGFDSYTEGFEYAPLTINDSAIYDAFNCLIYTFGGHVYINNSYLVGAGGPVLICDHVMDDGDNPDKSTGVISNVFVEGSILKSYIVGSEGWFVNYGAEPLVTQLKAFDALLNSEGLTVQYDVDDTNTKKLCLIAAFKSSSAEATTNVPIRGTFYDSSITSNKYTAVRLKEFFDLVVSGELLDQATATSIYEGSIESIDDLDTFYQGLLASIENETERASMTYLLDNAKEVALNPTSSIFAELRLRYFFGLLERRNQLPNGVTADNLYNRSLENWDHLQTYYAEQVQYLAQSLDNENLAKVQLMFGIAYQIATQVGIMDATKDLNNAGTAVDGNLDLLHSLLLLAAKFGAFDEAAQGMGVDGATVADYLYINSMAFQTYNGAFSYVMQSGDDYSLIDFSLLTGARLEKVSDYINVYLPNGMVAILAVQEYVAPVE